MVECLLRNHLFELSSLIEFQDRNENHIWIRLSVSEIVVTKDLGGIILLALDTSSHGFASSADRVSLIKLVD